jgi:CubicO group peptidase (beta-lactamase class C family)
MRRRASTPRFAVAAALVAAFILAVAGCSTGPAPAPTDAAIAARLDSIAQAAAGGGFSGLVVVHRGGKEILARGYGLANRATGARFTPQTIVPIGSNVKDFTKLAILALVEAGKLRLSDSLATFFPAAPADKRGITVDQLLDHRAGLPLGVAPDEEPLEKAAFLARVWAEPLGSTPGTEERYSNAGYSLLAAIVEAVTGEAFDDHVARTILAPLGLAETGLLRPAFDPARLAHGYVAGRDHGTMLDRPHDATGHLWSLRGNGGYLATAADQLAFFRAIGGGALLREPAHRARVFDARLSGVFAGSDLVSAFLYANFPREGYELVLASNQAEFTAMRLLTAFEPVLGLPERERTTTHEIAPSAPVELPSDGPWVTVRAWLDAFRAGDEAGMQRFFEKHAVSGPGAPPMERRLENFWRMRGDFGEFTIRAARTTPDGPELEVRTPRGERATIGFEFEPGGLLRGLRVQVG